MRSFLTSLLAFFASLLAGGVIAQALAVHYSGQEEWILVFMSVVVVAIATTIIFFIVQLASGTRLAAFITLVVLLVLFTVMLGGLIFWTFFSAPSNAVPSDDRALTIGLVAPNVAVILVQWLIVHLRSAQAAQTQIQPRFGRGDQPS